MCACVCVHWRVQHLCKSSLCYYSRSLECFFDVLISGTEYSTRLVCDVLSTRCLMLCELSLPSSKHGVTLSVRHLPPTLQVHSPSSRTSSSSLSVSLFCVCACVLDRELMELDANVTNVSKGRTRKKEEKNDSQKKLMFISNRKRGLRLVNRLINSIRVTSFLFR